MQLLGPVPQNIAGREEALRFLHCLEHHPIPVPPSSNNWSFLHPRVDSLSQPTTADANCKLTTVLSRAHSVLYCYLILRYFIFLMRPHSTIKFVSKKQGLKALSLRYASRRWHRRFRCFSTDFLALFLLGFCCLLAILADTFRLFAVPTTRDSFAMLYPSLS